MPTVVQSCRIEEDNAALLSRQAKRRHLEVSTLSSLYLKEKALEEEYPGIGFRDSIGGREAYIQGHRVGVCQSIREGDHATACRRGYHVKPRLLADENTSHRLVAACRQIEAYFPLVHISDWQESAYLSVKDPALLMALHESRIILVGFDRASIPMHAGELTRQGLGHAGVILFRRTVPAVAYGKQARLLVDLWREAENWDWADRIEYLPRP